jgi:glutamate-ammonia-ligase adenylyltransferase
MEHYYQVHGREWERYAMIKARVVAGDRDTGQELMDTLRPFVFRRYIDYGAYDHLREMKAMIDKEVKRKSMANNIKLGRGGIREVEFIAQLFQLIRGGRERSLQARKVLRVLTTLAEHGTLPGYVVEQLIASYIFLRNVEHRLQAWRDQQTHNLPTDEESQQRLAFSMGFASWNDFFAELEEHRQQVQHHFEQVFEAPQTEHEKGENLFEDLWDEVLDDDKAIELLANQGYRRPEQVIKQLHELKHGRTYSVLSAKGKERLDDLMPLMLGALGQAQARSQNIDVTFERLLELVAHIARRSVYIALLVETPLALSQLVRLCSASPWIAKFLRQYPLLLDELIDVRSLYAPPDKQSLFSELRQRLLAIPEEDEEQAMDALRHFKHINMLRVAAADVMEAIPLMQVSDQLTWLAEVILDEALEQAWQHMLAKHGRPICSLDESGEGQVCDKGFAIIGYGKLGGIELGYGSDLDMVFLHGGEDPNLMTEGEKPVALPVFFARLGQRLIHLLTAHTAAGVLYEADMRLRPDGASGMLVSNLSAFEKYQAEKAWLWEHQALVRARVVAGDPRIAERFQRIRRGILGQARDRQKLQQEVRDMREKMRAQLDKPPPGMFHLKQGVGGIVDIEFLVQYLVLAYAHQYPALLEWTDNIRILETLGQQDLMGDAESEALCEVYRRLRSRVHRLALQEEKSLVDDAEYLKERETVRQAWQKWLAS